MVLSRKPGFLSRRSRDNDSAPEHPAQSQDGSATEGDGYQPPALISLGPVWQVTLGSSSSGTADANSHYYW